MRTSAAVLVFALATASGQGPSTFQRTERGGAAIEIDASRTAAYEIPRSIYGTFLEPIGRSIYGGLWAQVLENPSLEGNLWSAEQIRSQIEREPALGAASRLGLPLPWEPLDPTQGVRYEPRWNNAANSSRSLLLMGLPGKQAGVRQQVYLPVHRVLRYTGSFHARCPEGPAEAEVSLRRRNHAETVFGRIRVPLAGTGWKRYDFTLELDRGSLARLEPADFVLALSGEARVLIDQVFLFPADHVQGMDPDMIALSRALKTPLVRYGGNFVSGYHWRDGVGPMDQRITMLNQAWGMPEYNHFGTDEFLEFCRLIGAEPQIALNLGTGTPEEAGDWVRYVNERWGGRKGGLLWELGNELYGTWQIGYPTVERIAARTRAFSEAVRRVDPRARLIATGADPDNFEKWNAALLPLAPAAFEYLSTHFVVGTANVRRPSPTPHFLAEAALALPVGLERRLYEIRKQIDGDPRTRGRVKIAFTEWLFHCPGNRVPCFSNLGGALSAAGFLNTLIRAAEFTPISNMTGLIEFGGIWKKRGQVYGVPAYWAFRMYSTADAVLPVDTRVAVDGYDVAEGNNRIPEIRDVPYLDVVAALNQARDRLTLFCVNRDTARDIPTKIGLTGFAPGARARAQTLAAASIYQQNDEIRPESVRPAESTLEIGAPRFEYVFPRASVTVIELIKR
jgi:alpha-N-arabinofuranosidase